MKILLSVPSGAHARTLLLPLKKLFEQDNQIEKVTCLSPGAPYKNQLFAPYGEKFEFIENPKGQEAHDELVKKISPGIVVTTTSGLDPNDPAILQAGKNNNIPTLTFIESWDNVYKMVRLRQANKPQALADQFIVWNEMMKAHLLRDFPELSEERISVIGAPRLDYFFQASKIPSRQALFESLGLPADLSAEASAKAEASRPLIHFTTSELYPFEYVVKDIYKALKSGQISHDPILYASVHPGGNMANHEGIKKYGVTVRYSFGRHPESPIRDFLYNPTEEELYMLVALFKHTNLLINHSSTTVIESLLADVPAINVKYGRPFDFWRWPKAPVLKDFQEHYADLVSDGATTIVKNKHELIAATQKYLEHPELDRAERQKTLKKMITTVDGTASQKVFDKIKEHAQK